MGTASTSHAWRARFRSLLWLAPLLLAGFCFWKALPDAATRPAVAQASLVPSPWKSVSTSSGRELITAPIGAIRPGMRVLAANPLLDDAAPEPLHIDPALWRLLVLRMDKDDGDRLDIELLRPLAFVEDLAPGDIVALDLAELGAEGPAQLVSIQPCPDIEAGLGRLVTGKFSHSAGEVIDVYVAADSTPIGCTPNHPFWSEDRRDFIRADELHPGETLRTADGTLTQLTRITPRRGPPVPVFNLEVEGEHVYHVGASGVLVHNAYGELYHYTNKKGYNAIRAGGTTGHFKASIPSSGNPRGVYFTSMSPAQIAAHSKSPKGLLGLTSDKMKYFFKVSVDSSSLKQLRGGRKHIVYSPEDVRALIIDSGPNPFN